MVLSLYHLYNLQAHKSVFQLLPFVLEKVFLFLYVYLVVNRSSKLSEPHKYIDMCDSIETEELVAANKLPLEFMLNALRLYQPISYELFQKRTGFTINVIAKELQDAQLLGLLELRDNSVITTDRGKDFLNDLLEIFV